MSELDNLLEQTVLPEEIQIVEDSMQQKQIPIQPTDETIQQVKEPSHAKKATHKKHLAEEESPQSKRPMNCKVAKRA